MAAASNASANNARLCRLTAFVNLTATPLTDQPSNTSIAGLPKSPPGRLTATDLVEEPLTTSTARPVASWISAATRASLRSDAAEAEPRPATRTRTALMKALPGAPAKRLESANQAADSRVVRITGG